MPKFLVRRGHDAFVYYDTVVDAETAEEARHIADSFQYDGEWVATGDVSEFDDYEIDHVRQLEEGESVEGFLTLGVTAQERDAVLTGLRLLQLALERGQLAPMLHDVFVNGGAHPGLDLSEIDALCQRINI
ncbi:hypothetical protein [Pelagibacterium luteolum]|uniref:Uncharacterized protein n=1 Tax=Pelagibacterium luteolum TaxID=440168 RepID=A0A1G7YWH2_9HYPH|nr:hypothetical protein [Pelagibacterium luteolum]SDH00784.1 hypothetical protein SAMN04487974_11623 [Pelagibacterium luteolum]